MAKSFRLNAFIKEDNRTGELSPGSFWGNWFGVKSNRRAGNRMEKTSLDEHCIWEKAVNFEVSVVQK